MAEAEVNPKGRMTPEQADSLIGAVGIVHNPSKGPLLGDYKVVGYAVDPNDDDRVKSLSLESVERVPARNVLDRKGVPTGVVVAEHPKIVMPAISPRWFKPRVEAQAQAQAKAK